MRKEIENMTDAELKAELRRMLMLLTEKERVEIILSKEKQN